MSAAIATVQTADRTVSQLQENIKQALQPMFNNPALFGTILTGISLTAGRNEIPHGLNTKMQGWFLTDINASVMVYRNAPFSATTLVLQSSGSVTVNIYVF